MEVDLSAEQQSFLAERIRDGRFASVNEAVREAVSLLEARENQVARRQIQGRKSLAQLFAESPFRGLEMDFPRDKDPGRPVDL